MNTKRDADTILGAWLDDGPLGLPDDTRRAIAVGLRTTPQRRGRFGWLAGSRRGSMFPKKLRLAVAMGALVLVVSAAFVVLQGRLPGLVPGASPSPTAPSQSPAIGMNVGPGVQSAGTIVFGLHDPASDSTRVYSISPDGSNLQLLIDGSACCPALSPDGRLAAVAVEEPSFLRLLRPAIITIAEAHDSETAAELVDVGGGGLNLVPGAWSREGNLALEGWSDRDPSKTGIYVAVDEGEGVAHGYLLQVTSNPGELHDIPIDFSPDGTILLFVRETQEGRGDLYLTWIDRPIGAALRQLNPEGELAWLHPAFGAGASWSPDGQRVAFSAFLGETASSRAYVVSIDSGEATPITDSTTFMTSARWSPNGEWIAYDFDRQPWDGFRDTWVVRPDGTDAHRVTTTRSACCAVWSSDSNYLLVIGSDREGAGMFIASADGSTHARLLKVDGDPNHIFWRSWVHAP